MRTTGAGEALEVVRIKPEDTSGRAGQTGRYVTPRLDRQTTNQTSRHRNRWAVDPGSIVVIAVSLALDSEVFGADNDKGGLGRTRLPTCVVPCVAME